MTYKRQERRLRIIGLLMLASQVLLLFFIIEWIRVQYREQERRLDSDLQNIFANTGERLSDSLLDQTVSIILRTPDIKSVQGMEMHVAGNINGDPMKIKDSIVRRFELSIPGSKDSLTRRRFGPKKQHVEHIMLKNFQRNENLPEDMKKVFRIALLQTASAKGIPENVFISDLDDKLLWQEFSKDLKTKKYSFSVYRDSSVHSAQKLFVYRTNPSNPNAIAVSDYKPYLFKTILPQLSFSILLLLLIAIAFWLAYRNMKQQALFSEQKDSMISNISHELKTPVATTKVALEALSSFNAIEDPVRTKKYLKVAVWEMERLGNMIDRVMNIMQTEAGSVTLQKEQVDIADLLKEITDMLQPIFSEKNIMLRNEKTEGHLQVSADKTHLTGALYNILDNAVKYGGKMITINLKDKGDQAVLSIGDDGPGISSEYHKKIFEHFFRVPSGNKHDVKGHGLGLSYARHIVEAHGGSIRLESSPGAGATFTISLPKNETYEL